MGKELSNKSGPGTVIMREDVEVLAVAGHGTMTPKALIIDSKQYRITEIIRAWDGWHPGGGRLHYWEVTSGKRRFTLCFQPDALTWMVEVHR